MKGILIPGNFLARVILSDKCLHTEWNLYIHRSATNMMTLHFASIIHYGYLRVGIHINSL